MNEDAREKIAEAQAHVRGVVKEHPEYIRARQELSLHEIRVLNSYAMLPTDDGIALFDAYKTGNTSAMSVDEIEMCQTLMKYRELCDKYRQHA